QLAAIGRGHARQRHRQVITQREVGLAGPLVLAAAQDLEDELVAFLAVLAHEDVEPLEGRGRERLEPVAGEHRPDERERALPGLELAGKEVTGPRGGIELRWHAPYAPRPGRSPSHRFPAAATRSPAGDPRPPPPAGVTVWSCSDTDGRSWTQRRHSPRSLFVPPAGQRRPALRRARPAPDGH